MMPIRRPVALLLVLHLLIGCVSSQVVKKATVGESAISHFQVIYEDLPKPMIMWLSDNGVTRPPPIIVALVLDPPLKDCVSVKIYANPISQDSHLLSHAPINVRPIKLKGLARSP